MKVKKNKAKLEEGLPDPGPGDSLPPCKVSVLGSSGEPGSPLPALWWWGIAQPTPARPQPEAGLPSNG